MKMKIIITHTVPKDHFSFNFKSNKTNSFTEFNTKFTNLFKYKKLTHWIFGHTHQDWNEKINNVHFICNPRGRPEDFDRINYNIKMIYL